MVAAAQRLRIIVAGYLVRGPVAGMAWHHLQFPAGLARNGHDVYFVEDSGEGFPPCYNPELDEMQFDPGYGLAFAEGAFQLVGLEGRWAYFDANAGTWLGPCADRIQQLCASADMLVNVSGVNPLRPWLADIPVRVFVDTDPAFTQIRHLTDRGANELAAGHTAFLTFGENVGQHGCGIPDDGYPWQATRQPILLERWPVTPGPAAGRFTTIMQWESYPALEFQGKRYGQKAASFELVVDVPARSPSPLELAVGSPRVPHARLRSNGWVLRDPLEVSKDLQTYQDYISGSKGEFSVAKHGYATTNSGWFSERSAAYLASGRPVVVQDTGFSQWLPTGDGVLAYDDADGAVAALEQVDARYDRHCHTARELARTYFDAATVTERLVEQALQPRPERGQACQ